MHNTLSTQCSKQLGVYVGREALAEYVRQKMGDRNFSTHEVARRAKAAGYTLSNGTVSNILNCRVKDVKENTLRALAKAFGVSDKEVFNVYHGADADRKANGFEQSDFARLYFKHGKLTKARQKEFERIWKMVEADYDRTLLEQEREKDKKGE